MSNIGEIFCRKYCKKQKSLYDVNEIKFNKVIYIYVYVHHEYIDNVYSNSEFQDSSNRSKSLKALNNYCS